MGPSGCGKSTLLNIMGMLDSPTGGWYVFNGQEVAGLGEVAARRHPQEQHRLHLPELQPGRRADRSRECRAALLYHNHPGVRAQGAASTGARQGRHRPSRQTSPDQLSGGQQQRVAIARALVGEPKLILADEPTGNLDTAHGEEVMRMLRQLNQEGSTIVMVTHSPAHADFASRVVNMLDGRILQERRRAA